MAVQNKRVSQYGRNYKISEHFTLGEFQCKDGSDTVLYSTDLLRMLEKLRTYGGFTIQVNSAYRTPAYNKKIGGASKSKHTEGYAADVVVKRNGNIVNAKLVCCLCQTLGFKGIGYISANAVHLDMRPSGSYRGDERSGYGNNVGSFYEYFKVSDKQIAELWKPQEADKPDEKQEEEEMTQEQFNSMMNNYLAGLAKKAPSDWSKEAREWAERNGIIVGNTEGDKQYQSFCTREQMVTFLYRLDKGDVISKKEIANALVEIAQNYK